MNKRNSSGLLGFIFTFILGCVLCFMITPLNSVAKHVPETTDPGELISAAIEDVMRALRTNEALYQQNPQKLRKIVSESALPYLDVARMAQLAMGKNWKTASGEQRDIIIQEFQTYLIRTYTNTLFLYRYTQPEILARDDRGDDKTTLKVRVKNNRDEPVVLHLRLAKDHNQWKINDVMVEGVSLVVTARGIFNDEIIKKGIDGFIQSLIEQNKKESS